MATGKMWFERSGACTPSSGPLIVTVSNTYYYYAFHAYSSKLLSPYGAAEQKFFWEV